MKTLGVGVLGFGFMGRTHTFAHRTIPFYYDPSPVECALRVVCRSNAAKLSAAKAVGGFERCTTDPMAVIEAGDVDIIHICTPNSEHLPALRAAIAAGKHVYVEKPVTGSLAEAEELEKLLPKYSGKAQVVLQYRCFPATLRAKQLIEEGFLGPVTHFRAAYLHSLDKPGTMMAVDVEEAAALLLRAADGAFGTVEASKIATGTEDELRFEIHGRHGAMRFNLMDPNCLEVFDERDAGGDYGGQRGWKKLTCLQKYPAPGGKFPGPRFTVGWIRAHVHSLYSFLKAIADDSEPSPSLAEGIHRQRILEAVRESAETGAWVDLPQPA
jgi:predicted dehydrogenase